MWVGPGTCALITRSAVFRPVRAPGARNTVRSIAEGGTPASHLLLDTGITRVEALPACRHNGGEALALFRGKGATTAALWATI